MEEKTLALAQTLARQSSIYSDTESPPGSPRSARTHASILQEKVQSFRSVHPWTKYLLRHQTLNVVCPEFQVCATMETNI
jgi:hypothetical protein